MQMQVTREQAIEHAKGLLQMKREVITLMQREMNAEVKRAESLRRRMRLNQLTVGPFEDAEYLIEISQIKARRVEIDMMHLQAEVIMLERNLQQLESPIINAGVGGLM